MRSDKTSLFFRRHIFVMLTLCAALFATACSPGFNVQSERRPQIAAAPDKATMMLAEAADKASLAAETLAAVEQARTPEAAITPVSNVPPKLNRAITINWVGPVEPITRQLADRSSYNFLVVGNAPPVPVVVSLDIENLPIVDALRSIGLQLGPRADVKVDANREVIEIHYAPTTSSGTNAATTFEAGN